MIYLVLAIASSASISIMMRASEKYVKNEMAMFMANYGVCMLMSLVFMKDMTQVSNLVMQSDKVTLILGILSGVMYLANFLFYKYNMKQNGIVMSATFMKLGVLVPTIMAIVVFQEIPRWTQVIGILVAVGAIILINFEKNALSESKYMIGLLLLLLLSGFTDSMANIFDELGDAGMKDAYLLVTFGMALLITIVFLCFKRIKIGIKEVVFGACIGIPNYLSSRFLLLALEEIEAVLVYPTYSVATMIVIMIVGVLVFREKLSKRKVCALGMILTSIALLNI
ncbi:MAG: EamA family transporter [Agathobacter sp.]|nr:EamA family transporter [Agathobacter sp.]